MCSLIENPPNFGGPPNSHTPKISAYDEAKSHQQISTAMAESTEYSVVLIGSSGGGTATLGHTNPIELLNTVHKELCHLHSDKEEGNICVGLSHAIFVSMCDGSGFDSLKKKDWLPENNSRSGEAAPMAKLYSVGFHNKKNPNSEDQEASERLNVHTIKGPISVINAEAKRLDAKLSKRLRSNHALIAVSSEPTIIHANSLRSCSKQSIPVTGSGGTSISHIAELYDLPIIGAQGSVASTTLTKARGWAMGLAREWGMTYDPKHNFQDGSRSDNTTEEEGQETTPQETNPMPSLKSILEAALPSFLFVCVVLRFFGSSVGDDRSSMIAEIEYSLRYIVPGVTCSILAATSRHSPSTNRSSQDQSTILMASALAGILASASASKLDDIHEGGSALAGLIAGASIPLALSTVSNLCVKYHITATMTNIVCGGGVGIIVGMIIYLSSIAHVLSIITGWLRCLIRWRRITIPDTNIPVSIVASALVYIQNMWYCFASSSSMSKFVYAQEIQSNELLPIPRGLGFVYGCIFVYGSKIGWYHSIFLPLIMLEMDSSTGHNAASLLGAIDLCTLVMVCAGICGGNLLFPYRRLDGNTSISWQALRTNILCGDFIEACYPSMEKSRVINVAAYLAAGISTEMIVCQRLLSSAYMPLPLSILISNNRWGMIAASSLAIGISFAGTLTANKFDSIMKKRD